VNRQAYSKSVRIYFFTQSWVWRALRVANGCFVGLWLGVLTEERLYAIVEEYFTRSRKGGFGEHNYHSKEWNRRGLFDWEKRAVTSYFGGCRRLLVLGAGGGREVLALQRLGYQVDGFESHPDLVIAANELLREEGLDSTVHPIAPDEAPDIETTYDGIIVGWGMYMSVQGRKRRIALLRRLRARTRVRCPILVSFVYRDSTGWSYKMGVFIANTIRRVLRRQPAEVGDWLAPYYVHYFTQDEIICELAEGRFATVHYDTTPYAHAVGIAT
jgi:hypothetical protein